MIAYRHVLSNTMNYKYFIRCKIQLYLEKKRDEVFLYDVSPWLPHSQWHFWEHLLNADEDKCERFA